MIQISLNRKPIPLFCSWNKASSLKVNQLKEKYSVNNRPILYGKSQKLMEWLKFDKYSRNNFDSLCQTEIVKMVKDDIKRFPFNKVFLVKISST